MCEDSADRLGKGPEEKERWDEGRTVLSGGTGTQLGEAGEVSVRVLSAASCLQKLEYPCGEAGIPGGTPKFQETPSIPACWCSAG